MPINKSWLAALTVAVAMLAVPLPAVPVTPIDGDLQVASVSRPEPGVRRSRLVSLNPSVLPQPGTFRLQRQADLSFELFPGVAIDAMFDRFDTTIAGTTWVGRVRGDATSTVTLVYGDGRLTGTFNTSAGTFMIRPAPADMRASLGPLAATAHEVVEVAADDLPKEAAPLVPVVTEAQARTSADQVMADGPERIDVLVVYTDAARNRWGGTDAGIRQLIAVGESETNTSYANAGILQRIRVVHTAFVPFVETNELDAALPQVRTGSEPGLEGVAALRDQVGADLVMLLVQPQTPNYCGIAYVMNVVSTAFAPAGFSVVHSTCVTPGLTFAHELGHNMGAHHDWYVATSTLPFTYAHGYVNPSPLQRWRTVMAYSDHCAALGVSCRRLVSWSNPDLRVSPTCDSSTPYPCFGSLWYFPQAAQGVPGGTRATCRATTLTDTGCDADNRRALNNTALTVANLRQAVVPGDERP